MSFYDHIDDNELILTACQFDFDNQYVRKLEDQYNGENRKEIGVLEKSC